MTPLEVRLSEHVTTWRHVRNDYGHHSSYAGFLGRPGTALRQYHECRQQNAQITGVSRSAKKYIGLNVNLHCRSSVTVNVQQHETECACISMLWCERRAQFHRQEALRRADGTVRRRLTRKSLAKAPIAVAAAAILAAAAC
eukprot:594566-Pleurochrysis_carterae.AAC.1